MLVITCERNKRSDTLIPYCKKEIILISYKMLIICILNYNMHIILCITLYHINISLLLWVHICKTKMDTTHNFSLKNAITTEVTFITTTNF